MRLSIFHVFCFFSLFFFIIIYKDAHWRFSPVGVYFSLTHYSNVMVFLPYLQSWGLLVVDPCGRAHGGWSSWSRHLLPIH